MSKPQMKTVVGNLALVHRDVRVTDASRIFACPGDDISRAGAFARSVFQRYGYGAGRWQRPESIFRSLRFLQNTFNEHRYLSQVINRHIKQSLMVRPSFNQINGNETAHGEMISIRTQTIKKLVQSNDRVKTPTLSAEERTLIRISHTQSIVQRLTERNIRIEENRFQQNSQPALGLSKPEYLKQAPFVTQQRRKPVETIVRDVSVQEQPDHSFQNPVNQALTLGQKSAQREINPVNIEAITDQIVRTIDQRIIAQRERLGRG